MKKSFFMLFALMQGAFAEGLWLLALRSAETRHLNCLMSKMEGIKLGLLTVDAEAHWMFLTAVCVL